MRHFFFVFFITSIFVGNIAVASVSQDVNKKKEILKIGQVIQYEGSKYIIQNLNRQKEVVLLCPFYNYKEYFKNSKWGWFYGNECKEVSLSSLLPKEEIRTKPIPNILRQQAEKKEQKETKSKEKTKTAENKEKSLMEKTPDELTDKELIELAKNPYYLNKLTAKQFHKMFDKVIDIAVMHPVQKNVAAYAYMTNFTRLKALVFAHAVTNYSLTHPLFNKQKDGTTSWSYNVHYVSEKKKTKEIFKKHRDNIGLIAFIKGGCLYCEKQLPILNWFQSDYNIPVLVVSKNYCVKTNGLKCIVNPQAFSYYNIQYEPTVILVIRKKDNTPEYFPVAVGLTDETTLTGRVRRYVYNFYHPDEQYSDENFMKLLNMDK